VLLLAHIPKMASSSSTATLLLLLLPVSLAAFNSRPAWLSASAQAGGLRLPSYQWPGTIFPECWCTKERWGV